MRLVYKYPFANGKDTFTLKLPEQSKIVHCGLDPTGHACLWIELNPVLDLTREREFFVAATGEELPYGSNHVGSWVSPPYVWHLYEKK